MLCLENKNGRCPSSPIRDLVTQIASYKVCFGGLTLFGTSDYDLIFNLILNIIYKPFVFWFFGYPTR